MSDPIAVSILAKMTSFYEFDGDTSDAHGPNPINAGLSIAGYEAGRSGQRLKAGSRGYATLSVPGVVDVDTALTIGGRFTFDGVSSSAGCFSVSDDFAGQNEVLTINVSATESKWSAWSWAGKPTSYVAETGEVAIDYPVTVQISDSIGNTASSPQVISISTPGGITAGASYDVYAAWEGDFLHIYVNGTLRASTTPPRPALTKTQIIYVQTGNQYLSTNSPCAHEDMLVCIGSYLTAAEIAWLYNDGAGRTYAEIVEAAA